MTVSREAIARELEAHPEICLGRENIAINRINQRKAILSYSRGVRKLEADHTQHKAQVHSLSDRIEDIARRLGQ
jgi:hypothetical protein